MKKIVVYGAGSFGREVKMLIEQINACSLEWEFAGFIADFPPADKDLAAQVVGDAGYLNGLMEPLNVAVAVGSPAGLRQIAGKINNPRILFPNLVHPAVWLHPTLRFGRGNIMAMGCQFTIDSAIGNFNVFNLGATVAHDAAIGSFNVFGPNAQISGNVTVGDGNLFGVSSVVLEKVTVGNRCILGASSLLVRNAEDDTSYFGVPAAAMRKKPAAEGS